MKKLSIGLSIILAVCLVGCEKKVPTPTKTEVRSIYIAGSPVYEKDYRLSASEYVVDPQH